MIRIPPHHRYSLHAEAESFPVALLAEAVARLLDIGNMCSFLERRENYAETFRTARAVLQDTIEHFGY